MAVKQLQQFNLKARLAGFAAVLFVALTGVNAAMPMLVQADAASQNIAKVSFTFDDGLSSALLAAQTLHTYGFTGTDYIITHCVGMVANSPTNDCAADNTKDYMSWSEINTLHTTYGWEIGSHTVDHPLLGSDTAGVTPLTNVQLDAELADSQAILAAQGYDASNFASPYGDYDNRALAAIAKYYTSHRAFQDYEQPDASELSNTFPYYNPRDSYPYNNALLTVEEVQGGVSVANVESYIQQAKANKQWLILVFHNITSGPASSQPADYQFSAADLGTIAQYVKDQSLPVVNVAAGLPTGTNLMPNSNFNSGIADGWTTNDPAEIKANQAAATTTAASNFSALNGHGSYDGTPEGPLNSIAITKTTTNTGTRNGYSQLFAPKITVDPATTYTIENFVNLTSTTGAINFYVDEYDAAGNYLNTQSFPGITASTDTSAVQVGNVNFMYTPSSAAVASSQLYADVAPGTSGYLDNMEWLELYGTPVTPPPTTKPGDVNGDGTVDALDLSTVLSNWNKTGATAAQGDLNGDGTVDALDLSTVLSNWSN